MPSEKFTLNDLKQKEDTWKKVILLNELKLLQTFASTDLKNAYITAEHNAWIVKTLVDKKQRYKFKNCNSIVLVGSGIYPCSIFGFTK